MGNSRWPFVTSWARARAARLGLGLGPVLRPARGLHGRRAAHHVRPRAHRLERDAGADLRVRVRARSPAARRLGAGTPASRPPSRCGVVLSALLCTPGLDLGAPDLGRVVGLGPAPHHHGRAALRLRRHPGAAPVRRRSGQARRLVGGGHDRSPTSTCRIVYFSVRWWNSLHQLQSTPETVSRGLPLAAAHQRLRRAVPDDRARSSCARGSPALRAAAELAPPLPSRAGAWPRGGC